MLEAEEESREEGVGKKATQEPILQMNNLAQHFGEAQHDPEAGVLGLIRETLLGCSGPGLVHQP